MGALLLAAVEACAAQPSLPGNSAPKNVPVTTIDKGNFSGVREPLQVVIRTPAEWESFWKRHVSIQNPASPPPSIDFSREMVAAVFLGEKTTGGYEVEITQAELQNSSLKIQYIEKTPTPGGMTIQALSQPFHLVKLPRYDAQVVFSKLAR